MRKIILITATVGGAGLAPLAPGTVGSAVGVAIWAALVAAGPAAATLGSVGLVALALWTATRAEIVFERPDDPRIVIDEVAGVLVALAFLPGRLDVAMTGFLLFRLFDIVKPPPCRRIERLPGGCGVVGDDLMAGAYANVIGQLLWRVALPEGWA